MQKGILNSAVVFIIATMIMVQSGLVYAADTSSVPECQFTAQPTADMMAKCQAAASATVGATSGATAPSGAAMPTGFPSMSAPEGMPVDGGFDASQIDFSKFGPVPQGVPGGVAPMFMGKELSGASASPMIGQLASALETIKKNLTEVEDDAQQLRDGQIKIDAAVEGGIKEVRAKYDEAVQLFQAGDYMGAAQKLQGMNPDVLSKQFGAFRDKQGASTDLIKDIRGKLGDSLKKIDQKLEGSDLITAKGDINAQKKILDQADSLIKAGKKSDAAALLKKMQAQYGTGQAQADLLSGAGLSASQITAILDQVSEGIDRTGSALDTMKKSGTAIPDDMQQLYDRMASLYTDAKSANDSGDTGVAMQKLQELRDMNPEQAFTAFKDKAFPKDRLKSILQQGKDGAKGLHLSIDKAKEFGADTAGLEGLSVQLDDCIAKAESALAAGDSGTFLTYMDQARNLNVREKVDAAIRPVANSRAKEALAKGLAAMNNAHNSIENSLGQLQAKKGNIAGAQELLSTIKGKIDAAQALYDANDSMNGGKTLDDGVMALNRLGNLLKDSGVTLSSEQSDAVKGVFQLAGDASGSAANIPSEQSDRLRGLLTAGGQDHGFDIQSTLGTLSPDLMDKVLAYRSSDKRLIDGIINDVIPLLPEEDRSAILEGKIGLLDESKSADKTIAVMKGIKGMSKDTLATTVSLAQQAKGYTFTSDIATSLQEQFASFNDKIQSGELKDQQGIDGYVQALKDQVAKSIAASNKEKYNDKLIPAKNIDDNNPLFDEMQYLRQDGAVAPDKNGNINLDQKMDKNAFASLLNKTIDKNAVGGGRGAMTIQDAIKAAIGAYKVKPGVDFNNAGQATKFFNGIGADINPANFKKQVTMKDAAEIVTAADQRWGTQN